ncbi:hypothetical protein GN958_ATG04124 [Phytophthora infestans]|uniref:WRKY19-like zinc finger domain-containing protein n=1 Tax=Phytophthora infestans TaxID=4787 RepID=A0A8S9V1G2_PHYIN|nr:hypothetical protein GN958_ATG04124 [Phytophthora infestans]
MRTKQSAEFEKQESTWIYLLHQQAPPQTCLSGEASLALPPIIETAASSNDSALFDESSPPTRGLLLPPPAAAAPTMMLSSQDKVPQNSLLTLSFPRLSDLGSAKHSSNKRACFPKKCDFPMCKNSSRSRGFCYSHGGGRRCRVDGCNNGSVSRDLCKRHGGGRRCRIAGCKSSSESGGLCYSHGGGRRCSLSWCSARAKKGGFCALHLTGDRTPPTDTTSTSTLDSSSSTDPNVVETLLSLAKDQGNVKVEQTEETTSSLSSSGKSAYAIASLLN